MEYRYHPIIEGLKVNEDGSEIILNGRKLTPKRWDYNYRTKPVWMVTILGRVVSVMKIVSECWHGMPPDKGFIVKLVDESKGSHYSNLAWSRRGYKVSAGFYPRLKLSREVYFELKSQRLPGEELMTFLRRIQVEYKVFRNAKNAYDQEEK